jgi:hypothetical protein
MGAWSPKPRFLENPLYDVKTDESSGATPRKAERRRKRDLVPEDNVGPGVQELRSGFRESADLSEDGTEQRTRG